MRCHMNVQVCHKCHNKLNKKDIIASIWSGHKPVICPKYAKEYQITFFLV